LKGKYKGFLINFYFCAMRGFILFGLLLMILAGCAEEETASKRPLPEFETDVDVESFGVTYVFSDSARVSANLYASHVKEQQEGEEGDAEVIHLLDGGVKIHILNDYGQVTSTILSDQGVYRRQTGSAELYGNVRLSNFKGEKLETEELFWDEKKDSVYTTKFVRIETPDKIITGSKGLKAKSDFSAYTIFGIQGEVETDEEL
jgi:LPS export ABC transporter protein LptC